MHDVVVVGGGPAGSAAAKKCAQSGLKTLLLEKHALPRDKMCTGLVAGDMAQALVKQEFGGLPQEVTVSPQQESGFMLHVYGVSPVPVNQRMPIAWRRDLDYWMNRKARQAGVEIWDGADITGIVKASHGYRLTVKRTGQTETVAARFVIGADGTMSFTRKWLFPGLKVGYAHCYRERFGFRDFPLERDYVHMFFIPEMAPYYFDIYFKEDLMLLEVVSRVGGGIRELTAKAKSYLSQQYGFDFKGKPLKVEACTEPILYRELFSGSFVPAQGNALLVGDAAGLIMPVTAEGIGVALKSGFLAGEAVAQAAEAGVGAADIYVKKLGGLLTPIGKVYSWTKRIREAGAKGPQELAATLSQAWTDGLRMDV